MVSRVVSTKLTEEEHSALLAVCNTNGQTPSSFARAAILDKLDGKETDADGREVVAKGFGKEPERVPDDMKPQSPKTSSSTAESEFMKFMLRLSKQHKAQPEKKSNPQC